MTDPTGASAADDSLATRYDVALLDLDGVVYVGDHAVPGAAQGLAAARAAGMRLAFVTNNAGRPAPEVAAHLRALGIAADEDDVVTSAQAGAGLLAERLPPGAPVLAVGGPGVADALRAAGLAAVLPAGDATPSVAAVLQGFGRDVAWGDLAAAAVAVRGGARWILTNPDLTLPLPAGPAPGNGSLARAVEAAAGRAPDDVAGKPHPALMQASVTRTGARRPLVVGDRLDTDIAGASRSSIDSLLVLTGIADIAAVIGAAPGERPDYIGANLGALVASPAATGGPQGPQRDAGAWCLPGARAWVDGEGELRVEAAGDWLAGVRCACAAAWAQAGTPRMLEAAASLERARRTVGS